MNSSSFDYYYFDRCDLLGWENASSKNYCLAIVLEWTNSSLLFLAFSLFTSQVHLFLVEEREQTHPRNSSPWLFRVSPVSLCNTSMCSLIFSFFLAVLSEDRCTRDTIDWASLVFCNQDLLPIFWTVFSCLVFSQTPSVHFAVEFFLSLICFMKRISSCWLLFSCVCWLLLLLLFVLSHRTFYYTSRLKHCVFLFLSSCFHPYFSITPHSLWLSTRICCVEHVIDCTPIWR